VSKKDKIIQYLLEHGNVLDRQSIKKIQEIDPNFDLNKFKVNKSMITTLYFSMEFEERINNWNGEINKKSLNNNNSQHTKISYPFKFRTIDSVGLQDDMNIFFRNIEKVIYIEEVNEREIWSWDDINGNSNKFKVFPFYYVAYQHRKENKKLKSFRFLLHSISQKATNTLKYNYFIDGIEIPDNEFKVLSRKAKLNSIIETE